MNSDNPVRKPAKILVVEDENIVAMDIERGLRSLGYEVVATAGSGKTAISLAEQLRPDLVLMDIRLQGTMDGIEAGRIIRHRWQIPIVFLTAHADESTVRRAKAAEPFGYLLKPFVDAELHTVIEIALYKRGAEKRAVEKADEDLRQSEERFRLLVKSLRDYAVFLLDPVGRIITWNPGAERITGYTSREIRGQHLGVFYPPEDVVNNVPDRLLREAGVQGQTRNEGWRLRKRGAQFWAETLITALRDRQGQLLGFAIVTRDVTERRQAEEEIRQLNASLEQKVRERTAQLDAANRELEAFTYSVAHDLRGPLRGLKGFLGILQEELGSSASPQAVDYLGRSASCADRMNHLIDDLLMLSGIGRRQPNAQPVTLNNLVREVISELQEEIRDRNIEWQIEDLPQLYCDSNLIKQVMTNLLGNALKYSATRDPAIIHVGSTFRQGRNAVYVSDNGVGFPMALSNKLFQPFSRLHAHNEFPGSGIGLAIVDRIIRKFGGHVWAEAEEGKGATFYFTLGSQCMPAPALKQSGTA